MPLLASEKDFSQFLGWERACKRETVGRHNSIGPAGTYGGRKVDNGYAQNQMDYREKRSSHYFCQPLTAFTTRTASSKSAGLVNERAPVEEKLPRIRCAPVTGSTHVADAAPASSLLRSRVIFG